MLLLVSLSKSISCGLDLVDNQIAMMKEKSHRENEFKLLNDFRVYLAIFWVIEFDFQPILEIANYQLSPLMTLINKKSAIMMKMLLFLPMTMKT